MVTEQETSPTGIGRKLKEAREANDLTQQDVCDSLNLLVRVVDDMETENWTRLPPAAFTRGYLRAYAKLLGIDADAIVEQFDAIAVPVEPRPLLRGEPGPRLSIDALVQKQPGAVLSTAVGLVVCCVLVVLWAVWPDGGDSSTPTVAATPAAGAAPMADSQPSAPAATAGAGAASSEPAVPAVATAASTKAAVPAVATSEAAAETAPAERSPTVNEQAAAAPSANPVARRITPDGDDRLDFVFAEDSWVEVKDRAGKRVFADLGRAGQSLELVGKAPFAILLGNAPGVDLSFNGERVVLSPHTRNNIATLALGQ